MRVSICSDVQNVFNCYSRRKKILLAAKMVPNISSLTFQALTGDIKKLEQRMREVAEFERKVNK